MLYYLFDFLQNEFNFPGAGLFYFISFRAAGAIVVSLLISWVLGGRLIKWLNKKQVGETVRDLGLAGQKEKEGTPTMGGLIILAAILIPTILFAKVANDYIILMLIATVWMGAIGFLDDYIKVFKKDKEGLAGKFKIIGQVGLGIIVGSVIFFSTETNVRIEVPQAKIEQFQVDPNIKVYQAKDEDGNDRLMYNVKDQVTTIPFIKSHEIDYGKLFGNQPWWLTWILFTFISIFIVTAVSNAANLTDGIDGLATGTSAIIGATLGIIAYLSGNAIFADYLNIMYLPSVGELMVFSAAFIGACIGFLWYNAYPAKVFMGDTGSLALGGIIATFAIAIRKELLIPILCGIFLMENLSVIIQVFYFKYTKKRFGEGKRVFLMSPLHHHFQKKGMHESKIVSRFWIVGIMLAVVTMVTLKLQ